METAMRNVSINDRTTPSMSPLIKTEPSSQQHQDQPLDFSTKVRTHTLEADEGALRKVSNDSAIDVSEDNHIPQRNVSNPPVAPGSIEDNGRPSLSQPRVSMQMPNIHTFLPQSSMAGMGMFYPGAPVFPNFLPPGFPPAPMWPNPMAAMMQHQQEAARKLISQASNGKQGNNGGGIRTPFNGKQLLGNKQELMGNPNASRHFHNSAPSVFPNSHLAAPNIPDPGILAEALKSHEEMFTAYKQQVLNQKANDDAKRNSRRQLSATVTNGNHSSISQNGACSNVSIPESASLSQINENQTMISSRGSYNVSVSSSRSIEEDINEIDASKEALSSSDDDKNSAISGGSIEGDTMGPSAPVNGNSGQNSADYSTVPSLHSSDESLQTSDGRRSLTPAHSSNGELNDITGMRPRSMTLPTQTADSRLMSYSPSPSVLSTGNSSGPGTPNSRNDRGFRKRARTLPDDQKIKKRDDAYWERRRKNNEAAKRSRDSRRAKEDEIAIRAAFLEQENIRLRLELASLKTQTAKLRSELIIFQGPEDRCGPLSEGS